MWFFVLFFIFPQYKQYDNFNFASDKIISKIALGYYPEKTSASTRTAIEVSSEIKKLLVQDRLVSDS